MLAGPRQLQRNTRPRPAPLFCGVGLGHAHTTYMFSIVSQQAVFSVLGLWLMRPYMANFGMP